MIVELGDEAKCKISGFQGIVTSIAKCLTGCDRVALRAKMKKDGTIGEEYWFDAAAVDIVHKRVVVPNTVQEPESPTKKVGGPITKSNLKG